MSKFYLVEMDEKAAEKIMKSSRTPAAKRGAVFSDAWKTAKEITGYNEASPIWGKTHDEVLSMIEDGYVQALKAVEDKDLAAFNRITKHIGELKAELGKRQAANELARASRKS